MHPLSRFLVVTFAAAVLAVLPSVAAEGDVTSPMMAPGDTFRHTFESPGSSKYHCHPHPWMEGTIKIEASDGAAPKTHTVRMVEPKADSKSWVFEPAALTIKAGDTVEWVNEGSKEHQVMAWISETGTTSGHGDHAHDHGVAPEEAPGVPLVGVLAALGVLALRRRG